MNTKAKFLALSLLLCATASHALSLGRMRGAALIGQRLDVTVQVQADAGEDLASQCLEAEVFHADTRQEASRVRVTLETAATTGPQVRIQSTSVIDEPIVTVYLRVGCAQKSSRRYVLLADVASELQAPVTPLVRPEPAPAAASTTLAASVAAPAPSSSPSPAPSSASSAATAGQPAPATATRSKAVSPAVVAKAPAPKAAPPKASQTKSVSAAPASGFKLKLDPLEYFSDRVGKLDSGALLAQAAQATPDAQKMQKLETDVRALQAVASKSEANLADMRRRLEQAQEQAYPPELVYGLGATTLLGLLAAAGFWWRGRRAPAKDSGWWDANAPAMPDETALPATVAKPLDTLATPDLPPQTEDSAPLPQIEAGLSQTAELSSFLKGLEPASQVDVSLVDMSESTFDKLLLSSEPAGLQTMVSSLRAPLQASAETPMRRHVSPAEVSDVRQKAEFFITLGQTEQAAQALQYCIAESELPYPALYLDLLALMHSLSDKTEFGLLRDESERLFNLVVPEFVQFGEDSQDLQAYPEVLSSLCNEWPGPGALPLLETYLYRDPHGSTVPAFDMAAFQDLMLLADIAGLFIESGDPVWVAGVASVPVSVAASAAAPMASPLAEPLIAPVAAAALVDSVDLPLDFELDLPAPAGAAPVAPDSAPGNLIDFDFDLGDLPKPGKP